MNRQESLWNGPVGKAYTDAFILSPEQVDKLWEPLIGIGRAKMLADFTKDLPRDIRILEVGCNVGNMLNILDAAGFTKLYGLELQSYAVKLAHKERPGLNIVQGEARDIPFRDGWFDLVFTSGVLIHVAPESLEEVLRGINRVAKRYVMGYEYYAEKFEEIPYCGGRRIGMEKPIPGAMWRGPYRNSYETMFGMKLLRSSMVHYLDDPKKQDEMFLLEKA